MADRSGVLPLSKFADDTACLRLGGNGGIDTNLYPAPAALLVLVDATTTAKYRDALFLGLCHDSQK